MFPEEVGIIRNTASEDLSQLRSSKSYRFKNKTGKYKTVLQQNSIICAENQSAPIAIFWFISDITHFTENGKVVHSIEKYDADFLDLWNEDMIEIFLRPDVAVPAYLNMSCLPWVTNCRSSYAIKQVSWTAACLFTMKTIVKRGMRWPYKAMSKKVAHLPAAEHRKYLSHISYWNRCLKTHLFREHGGRKTSFALTKTRAKRCGHGSVIVVIFMNTRSLEVSGLNNIHLLYERG